MKNYRMNVYFIANARMPTEKAHGIQIAKMCEAFIEAGADVTLVVPDRKTDKRSVREFYGLRVDIPKVTLFAFDWYAKGRVLYRISSFSFMVSSFLYLWRRRHEKDTIVYTVDFDNWSYAQLMILPFPYFSEMHGSKPRTFINRFFFWNISGVITINRLIKESLQDIFSIPPERVIVEPDAVDAADFAPIPLEEARKRLGLARDMKVVLYVGRILYWKGLEILSPTARLLGTDTILGVVGGGREQFIATTGVSDIPENLIFYGNKPYSEVSLWIAAADAVLMTSTAHNDLSYRWTSPMKAFEYMACGVPIIAADTPSMREIITSSIAYLYQPDNAESLAHEIRTVFENPEEAQRRGDAALVASRSYSWRARAERILAFMFRRTKLH